MALNCDICGKSPERIQDIRVLKGITVAKATATGYLPNLNVPTLLWRGYSTKLEWENHWENAVKTKIAEEWEVCNDCSSEIDGFNYTSAREKRLIQLFNRVYEDKNGDAFVADIKKLGSRSQVLILMQQIEKEGTGVEHMPLVVTAMVKSMDFFTDATWGNDYKYWGNDSDKNYFKACTICGAKILWTTYDRHGGLCALCSKAQKDKVNIQLPPFKNFHTLIIWQDKGYTLKTDDFIGLLRRHIPDYKKISNKYPDGKLGAIQVPIASEFDWQTTAKNSFSHDILDENKYLMRKITIGTADLSGSGIIYVFYELDKTQKPATKSWWEFWK